MNCYLVIVFFFKQKTAYEMRISDWSSDVCSSDLFDSFTDLAEHYASLTSADAFAGAFTSEITANQLSIHDEPTADDLPDADAARKIGRASCRERVCQYV